MKLSMDRECGVCRGQRRFPVGQEARPRLRHCGGGWIPIRPGLGGLGGIYVIPLLLPWIAIAPTIELMTGRSLLDNIWAGPLTAPVAGAINAYLLFLILRFVDRHRRRKRDSQSETTQ